MPEVVVDAKDIDEFEADDRGRINLGTGVAHGKVEVAVLDVVQKYSCTDCEWSGGTCDREDNYPVCPECGEVVDVNH